jgi:hypothetical protein
MRCPIFESPLRILAHGPELFPEKRAVPRWLTGVEVAFASILCSRSDLLTFPALEGP